MGVCLKEEARGSRSVACLCCWLRLDLHLLPQEAQVVVITLEVADCWNEAVVVAQDRRKVRASQVQLTQG